MYKRKYVYALIDLMEKESERGIGEKKKIKQRGQIFLNKLKWERSKGRTGSGVEWADDWDVH